MLKVYLMLVLSAAAVFAESVRETETWVPLKNKASHEELESSGHSQNGDFEFAEITPTIDDEDGLDDDEDDENYDDMSGSGGAEITDEDLEDEILNSIPDFDHPVPPKPTMDDPILVKNNEVLRRGPNHDVSETSNVLMSHAGDDSLFSNKEVLAAVIAGGAVGLVFAVVLIVLLIHFVLRIKKKDEGSYDLGKTPIYKKAPTTEIYA
ncbi:syndecan-4 [Triplophysa rosa]|uniref:Sdc4 protein n=1 Tax=Triplophysa rosa TaxID=992332 RepID=A0A9W7WSU1_TRIRA|nr:syndecan-4 [Triplophysa rosa]KAI7807679.1 Sdc4 protein [Triplophysa rosa]